MILGTGNDGEELEAGILRADHPFGVDLRGTTPEGSCEDEGALDVEGE
jgi:hypothetical protein